MFKKILSTALAMAMVLSMAVSTSAALGKPGSSTPSTKTEQSSSSSKKSSSSSSSSKEYDLCKTQLAKDKLALSMHNTFLSGLKANKDKITVSIKGYTEKQVYAAFQSSLQMIFDEHPEIF